jgi:elongation factor Ts
MVKELREITKAGMMDCKKALSENDGDMDKAQDFLRQKGLAVAAKRSGRATSEGIIEFYSHSGGKLAAMVEVGCETDFVAKTDAFIQFAKDMAMHVAAMNPVSLERDEVPAEMLEREKAIYVKRAQDSGKPDNIIEKIVTGQVNKYYSEICMLEQKFVKDPDLTIQDMLNSLIASMGENISIKRFARFAIGA